MLRIPLLALPGLTRAAVDAAVPGLAEPRIEALLRSLPKEARRNLIPIGEPPRGFLGGAWSDRLRLDAAARLQGVAQGAARYPGVPASFRPGGRARPSDAATGGDRGGPGFGARQESRRIAPRRAPARRARNWIAAPAPSSGRSGAWRRFEIEALPDRVPLELERGDGVGVSHPGSDRPGARGAVRMVRAPRLRRVGSRGAAHLARTMLAAQARDLGKTLSGNPALLLAASPYAQSADLIEALLHLIFRRACFGDCRGAALAPGVRTRRSTRDARVCIPAWMRSSPAR